MPRFDYLIVGAGFFGAVFAREMTDAGFRCLVIDKRNHIAGNCFTQSVGGIDVHRYGPHIFHTNSRRIWDYICQYAEFHPYRHKVKACCRGRLYSLPINLTTLHQVWGVLTPEQARAKLDSVREPIANPANLEQWALSQVGRDIYELFFHGYTQKQWGKHPRELPASILKRLPIRLNFNDDYFDDRYQGIPIGGYTAIFEKLLAGVEVRLGTDFFANRAALERLATKIAYTGMIDRFFECSRGELDWRSLRFETRDIPVEDFQGGAIVNHCDADVPFTRVTEFKHFLPQASRGRSHTIITREFPVPWSATSEPYYPINSAANEAILAEYRRMAPANVLFGGRLGDYRYYDMHQVIGSALAMAERERAAMACHRSATRGSYTIGGAELSPAQAGRADGRNRARMNVEKGDFVMSQVVTHVESPKAADGSNPWALRNYRLVSPVGRELARNVVFHPNGGIYTDLHTLRVRRWSRLPNFPDAVLCGGTVWDWAAGQMTTGNFQALPNQRWRPGMLRRRCNASEDSGAGIGRVSLQPQPPVPKDRSEFEIVIAKYKEDVAWADCFPDNATIYCKDPGDRRFISLPNIGREYGTYLYHIVQRYDSLAEKTFFVQGDPFFHRPLPICRYAAAEEDFTTDFNYHQTMEQVVNWGWPDQTVDASVKADFLRRLGRSPDISNYRFTWGAQFAVSRRLIRRQPKSYYQALYDLSQLAEVQLAGRRFDNLHIGFLFEFFWENIFCETRSGATL